MYREPQPLARELHVRRLPDPSKSGLCEAPSWLSARRAREKWAARAVPCVGRAPTDRFINVRILTWYRDVYIYIYIFIYLYIHVIWHRIYSLEYMVYRYMVYSTFCMHIRILQSMISGIHFVLALGTRM